MWRLKKMKIRSVLLAILFMTHFAYANDCEKINDQAKQVMEQNNITGMAVAIINQNQIAFCNYGYTNKNKKEPITNKSIFEIASITKTFTALLAGIAVSEHRLDLDAPITKYIPELSVNKNYTAINTKELLTHVAGLPLGFEQSSTEKELIKSAVNMKFTTKPANYYRYSNPGIALSGLAMTRIYHTNYQSLLDVLILDKLGMKYTSINVSDKHKNLTVTGYNAKGEPQRFMQIGIENPAGGLKSNSYDLAQYLKLQIGQQDPKLRQALAIVHKNYFCLNKNGTYQQLAWEFHPISELAKQFQADTKNRNILVPRRLPTHCKTSENGFIDKTGNSSGMTSYIGYLPSKKIGVVILSNNALKPDIVNLGRYVLRKTTS